jgi:TonB family protein
MTAALLLDNLFAWSAQVAILVAAAAVASIALSHPRARLIFWQGILAITLLLPAVEPWRQPMAEDSATVAIASSAEPVRLVHPQALHFVWKREYLLFLIGAGASLRFLWISAGLFRLRRHRLDARMLAAPPVRFSNPRVRWFVSNTVGGPVTFGFLNPSILLPTRVVELDADLREAIAHHELAHVRRRDWLFVLFEEAIRSLLWFHPAIWIVLSRIQIAREQVVDAEVVGLTRDRERYLDALVAVAAHRLQPNVVPATLFLKKSQLAVRVAAVLKETNLSRPRLLLSFTSVCSAALIAARLAVWVFPMQAPAQTRAETSAVTDGTGVTVDPGAKILHRSAVFFSAGAPSGTVVVESTVNGKGEVTDAHVISGPDELRNAALSSVLNWHFSPEGLSPTVQSVIRFDRPAAGQAPVVAPQPAVVASPNLRSIQMNGVSDELAEKVMASLPVHVGDSFGREQSVQVRAALKAVDEHLTFGVKMDHGDAILTILLPQPVGAGRVAADVPIQTASELPPPADGAQRIRVGGNVQALNLTRKVTPIYPPLAKQNRIQGMVRFTAVIGADGTIVSLQLVEGHPLLAESAREAVAQWQYKPTLLNGNPVEVLTQIDVNYTLSQ